MLTAGTAAELSCRPGHSLPRPEVWYCACSADSNCRYLNVPALTAGTSWAPVLLKKKQHPYQSHSQFLSLGHCQRCSHNFPQLQGSRVPPVPCHPFSRAGCDAGMSSESLKWARQPPAPDSQGLHPMWAAVLGHLKSLSAVSPFQIISGSKARERRGKNSCHLMSDAC